MFREHVAPNSATGVALGKVLPGLREITAVPHPRHVSVCHHSGVVQLVKTVSLIAEGYDRYRKYDPTHSCWSLNQNQGQQDHSMISCSIQEGKKEPSQGTISTFTFSGTGKFSSPPFTLELWFNTWSAREFRMITESSVKNIFLYD